ncbi:MAG: VCBS repeat-containing protein [Candidatus Eisenbacteria bacterium]
MKIGNDRPAAPFAATLLHVIVALVATIVLLQPAPARAYEVDTHFTMTFIQCRIMGLTEAEALTVATYDQGMDDSEGVIANTGPGGSVPHPTEEALWHSIPVNGTATEVLSRKAALWQQVLTERSTECQLRRLGVFFHYQQDTWAHRCHPNSSPTSFQPYQVPTGHARFGSQPDRPPYDPVCALRSLEEGLSYLSQFMTTSLKRAPNPLFNNYTPALGAIAELTDNRKGLYFHQLASDASTPAHKLVTDLIRAQINCYKVSINANPYFAGRYTADFADTTGTSGHIGTKKSPVLVGLLAVCAANCVTDGSSRAIGIPAYVPRISTLTTAALLQECSAPIVAQGTTSISGTTTPGPEDAYSVEPATAGKTVDLLTIEKIKCIKPAGGVAMEISAVLGGVRALGNSLLPSGECSSSLGTSAGTIVLTAVSLPKSMAAVGMRGASQAVGYLDGKFSGTDELIVQVGGKQIIPGNGFGSGKYFDLKAGQEINTNIRIPFYGKTRIDLIEYDLGTDNDDLGGIEVIGGEDYRIQDRIVMAPDPADGSVYYITYSVKKGAGDQSAITQWILCGTNQCVACGKANCASQDYSQVDRDKNRNDLKACPGGYRTVRYELYDQIWPAADVYCRVCGLDGPVDIEYLLWGTGGGVKALAGDYDGDGTTDVALTGQPGWKTIPVAFSEGAKGTYRVTNSGVPAFAGAAAVAGAKVLAGDVNGDKKTDLIATGGARWGSIAVAISLGNGTFRIVNAPFPNSFPGLAAAAGSKAVAGDFNGDRKDDVALTGGIGWTTIPIAFSNGDGTFRLGNPTIGGGFAGFAASAGVMAVSGDFNGDGISDVALTGGIGWGSIPVAFANRTGTFNVTNAAFPGSFGAMASKAGAKAVAADFDGDGKADIALTGVSGWTAIPLALSNGDGTFRSSSLPGPGNFGTLAATAGVKAIAADFNGDRRADMGLVGGNNWMTFPIALSSGSGASNAAAAAAPQPQPAPTPPAPAISLESIVGNYRQEPVQNDWHIGAITADGGGFRWTNKAGLSWSLTPDLANNRLLTGTENPYYSGGSREFKLIVKDANVTGFSFNGGNYMRQ